MDWKSEVSETDRFVENRRGAEVVNGGEGGVGGIGSGKAD